MRAWKCLKATASLPLPSFCPDRSSQSLSFTKVKECTESDFPVPAKKLLESISDEDALAVLCEQDTDGNTLFAYAISDNAPQTYSVRAPKLDFPPFFCCFLM